MLTKPEIVEALVESTGLQKKQCRAVVEALGDLIVNELKTGRDVRLPGVGKVVRRARPALHRVNPVTRETFFVPPGVKLRFLPSEDLKRLVKP